MIGMWGTPESAGNHSHVWPSKTTHWIVLVRYELNQDKRLRKCNSCLSFVDLHCVQP